MTATELHVLPTVEGLAQAAALFIFELARERIQAQERFTIALSGGSTPRRLYQILASPEYAQRIAWDRWHVFWSDERCVPPDHTDSNYLMAREALLDRVTLPSHQVHRMRGEAVPQESAEEYERELLQFFEPSEPALDLILLGMGEDGHTASLFPGTDALREERRLVVANPVPHLNTHRMTFTLPLINMAKAVAFLVSGAPKAQALRQVVEPTPGEHPLPAGLVRPGSGSAHWFLDRDAASHLEKVSA